MKIINFQLEKIYYLVGLIFAIGCNSPSNNQIMQGQDLNDLTSVLSADTTDQSWNSKLNRKLAQTETAKQDTNLARLYIEIGDLYIDNDFEKAKEYFNKSKNLSDKLDWNQGRYLYASGLSGVLYKEGLIDSGIQIVRPFYEIAKQEKNEYWIAKTSINIGGGYFYKNWYNMALEYFMEALSIMENSGDTEMLSKLYDNIGVVYRVLSLPEKAIEYHKKALALFDPDDDHLRKGYILYNLATSCNLKDYDETEYYFKEALRICKLHNSQYVIAAISLGLGNLDLDRGNYKDAENYFREALKITAEINNPNLNGLADLCLGYVELFKRNINQAHHYCVTSLETAQKMGYAEYQVNAHRLNAVLYAIQNDISNFRISTLKADSVERVMARESNQRAAEEMEVKYETEKKELKISALEKEKRLFVVIGIAGGIILLLALSTFLFLWRFSLQKRQLAEQKVKQLEKEKQLVATQAVLDGETLERARLARDLHDGLGSMLTGVKLNLLEMKKGVILKYEEVERFDSALGLLDQSVSEMRRVAHHLMPDSLSRFGLKSAVSDFCSNLPSVKFSYYGDESQLDSKLEVMIYRSIHELVNNALKHAKAEKIIVQIIQEKDRIAFTVQDDGCGFDSSNIKQGMGLQNIRTRIASYNGILNIDSKAGEGTEVNVELRIENEL